MKNLIKDEKAILNPLITCILSLACVVIMYKLMMPIQIFITNSLIAIGADAAQLQYYLKLEQWGFIIFSAAALIVLIGYIYKKTHDTQEQRIW